MEEHISKSDEELTPIGRVINALLCSRPRHLEAAMNRLSSSSRGRSGVMLDESLCYIQKYARDAIDKREPLDQILIPMIENFLKTKKQILIILKWLFQDELVFEDLLGALVGIIKIKEDRYIAFGWCILIRYLLDHGLGIGRFSVSGKQERPNALLKALSQSMPHLSFLICEGSILQDEIELPTRLSVAAADCTVAYTEALTRKMPLEVSNSRTLAGSNVMNRMVATFLSETKEKASRLSEVSEDRGMEWLLWDHMDELVILVQKLHAWNRKSRPLHAKGLELVLKWLRNIRGQYVSLEDEADGTLKVGVMLLSSCWKHYVMLLHLEGSGLSQKYMELLDQYVSALQFYTENDKDEPSGQMNARMETVKFHMNCFMLLLGRLDKKQFENAVSDSGLQMSNFLSSLLQSTDEDVIDGAVSIIRALIFRTSFSSIENCPPDLHQMEPLFSLLLSLLDERDDIARSVVLLAAEFCFFSPHGKCLEQIFARLSSGSYCRKGNAIDVILELIHVSSKSGNILPQSAKESILQHMIDLLGDEEPAIRVRVSNTLLQIDPHLVLPALVPLVYSLDEHLQSSACDCILALLERHNQNVDLIIVFLDFLSNLNQNPDVLKPCSQPHDTKASKAGSKFDPERVLHLIPRWAKTVPDWSILIGPLIDKMFADPSNVIILRFLSYISEHLAGSRELVLQQVLLHSNRHKEMDQNHLSISKDKAFSDDVCFSSKGPLFINLCPLLIIRLLPLEVFNDINSSVMYGQCLTEEIARDTRNKIVSEHSCIASLLINRAFHILEFEDVRKLAAELCGRLHPQVLLPMIETRLENSAFNRNMMSLKACLFSICSALVIRGIDVASHPLMNSIRKTMEMVLLWPSLDGDEVSKAQHGCIDCLALIICAEIQALDRSKDSHRKPATGENSTLSPFLAYILGRLISNEHAGTLLPSETSVISPLPFRLCMANVLISTCQKISISAKPLLATGLIPVLISSIEVVSDSKVRAACLQVLFSAVYYLKSAIAPYSLVLLKLSIKGLRKGSEKEKIACAKLMAALMASEDEVIESLSPGLLEAKSVLSAVSAASSSELQQLCKKLLLCITSPLDDFLQHLSKNQSSR